MFKARKNLEVGNLWPVIVEAFEKLMAYLQKEYDHLFLVAIEFLEYGWLIFVNTLAAIIVVAGKSL